MNVIGSTPAQPTKAGAGSARLVIAGTEFQGQDLREGRTWQFAGPSTPGTPDTTKFVVIGEQAGTVPPIIIGQIAYASRQLTLNASPNVELIFNGDNHKQLVLPKGEHTVRAKGTHTPDSAMPPQHFDVRFEIKFA
jgi:hypothetical protein